MNADRGLTRRMLLGVTAAMVPLAARAQSTLLDQGKKLLGGAVPGKAGSVLSDGEIGGGLREALKVASQRVVGQLGKADGYNADPLIRIPLPGPLQSIAGPLKSVGAERTERRARVRCSRTRRRSAAAGLIAAPEG